MEWKDTEAEKERNIINCIGNDPSFREIKPIMYSKWQGGAMQSASRFNLSLIQTFSMKGTEPMKWM